MFAIGRFGLRRTVGRAARSGGAAGSGNTPNAARTADATSSDATGASRRTATARTREAACASSPTVKLPARSYRLHLEHTANRQSQTK